SSTTTYIVNDTTKEYRGNQTMPRAEYEEIARLQEEYIAGRPMIVIDGYISNAEEVQTAARLVIERANANVAGMQKFLYFERSGGESQVTVIDTPNLPAPGYPNDRCIAVDLDNGVTRVLNSDYFGESKKGGLRMWNKIVYDKGGLPMHAGCKVIPTAAGEKTIVVIGLSGTGKTTTTFRRQGDSKAVQDDFIALMPGAKPGTSPGGKDEAGKALRVPGTNPFFPLPNELQGNRFLELLRTHSIDVYLMNTGWIVDDCGPDSKKVTVEHSSACMSAIA